MPARPLRRSVAVLACLASLLAPQVASPTPASLAARGGDRGSGAPTWSEQRSYAVNGVRWSDVGRKHWARTAIDYAAATNDWMRDSHPADDGTLAFEPDTLERRELFARAMYRAFGTDLEQDPDLSFADLLPGERFYRPASVAVAAGWMRVDPDGSFRPQDPVTTREVHRALVLAIGMGDLAAGADALHLQDGTPIDTPKDFGTLLIGMKLGLRFDHGDDLLDVGPDTPLPRAEVAWSMYRAATVPSWVEDALAPYATMELPNLSENMQQVVAFAVRYVGSPYVWGGEWDGPAPAGYCCGYQPVGGFDCSGITWWVMKQAGEGWDNTPPRGYEGWDLGQRSSASMASIGHVKWRWLEPGDLMFYDGDDDGTVDHVNTYLGNGWAVDSGASNGGVTITYVAGNWYEDHFVHGRRILG
jgi:cell wall-associated NlpC family hydrolase